MRKEALVAILLGIGLGLVFTFGVYTANQSIKEKKTEKTVEIAQTSPSPSATVDFTVDSPENYLVTKDSKIEVSGHALPGSVLVVYSDDNEAFSQTDDSGLYSLTFPLVKGSNILTISNINGTEKQDKIINVVYNTEI